MMTRRELLAKSGAGFGMAGLCHMLARTGAAAPALKTPHFPAKAKHVIFLFLNGGPSHIDTFDPKPLLSKYNGRPLPVAALKTERRTGNVLASPWAAKRYGQSGIEMTELFPRLGEHVDDVCIIRSMHTQNPNHTPALFLMNTGSCFSGRPSMGAWLTYGLGSENENLPGFFVLCPGAPMVGPQLWSSAFLPASNQGTYVIHNEKDPDKLVAYLKNSKWSRQEQRDQLDLLGALNRLQAPAISSDPQLEANIQAMETAFRMQSEAPGIFDLQKEDPKVRERYGDSDFGRGCLLAARMVEKGVRMVQVYYGNQQPWDAHEDIMDHERHCRFTDQAVAALIGDLKSRGLLSETLIVLGGEFGRTPVVEVGGEVRLQYGRDHNSYGFSMLLAGGGIKGGTTYGATDEFGFKAIDRPVHVHDLHATILHMLGVDHTKLTYRYSGRDFRLTDVHGTVVKDVIA